MPTPFSECRQEIQTLSRALVKLERSGSLLEIPPLPGREWYELLTRKLLPQLVGEPFIVAAVTGGTNIGKSVIFNHIAKADASATSPLASMTRHPVCLVPAGFQESHDLSEIFPGFVLEEWTDPAAALRDTPEHYLYWRHCERLPENLLVLDTPDIDSDAPINWQRADYVRHAADVLIVVLTQQKYNDAAVKRFFRKAAQEDKSILVVFNQLQLPEDEPYWPRWLETFCSETGIHPHLVYVAPHDRAAAEGNRLQFYQRNQTPCEPAADTEAEPATASAIPVDNTPRDLAVDLSELHFSEIKMQTLKGSLRNIVSVDTGVPGYLAEIRHRSSSFQTACTQLTVSDLVRLDGWPVPPQSPLVAKVRQQWHEEYRTGITKKIHATYGTVGAVVLTPFRWVHQQFATPSASPQQKYQEQEWQVLQRGIEALYDELERLSQLGNELLKPRLDRLLAGQSRAELFDRLKQAHEGWSVDEDIADTVRSNLQNFEHDQPTLHGMLRRVDLATAIARPVVSVGLLVAGGVGVEHVADVITQNLVVHLIGDTAGGVAATAAGEGVIEKGAPLANLLTWFRQLQAAFVQRRAERLATFIESHAMGSLMQELQQGAALPQSEEYRLVRESLDRLTVQLERR